MIRYLASSIITVLEYAMLFTAIISWIPQLRGSKIQQFLYQITEPIIAPFRKLLYKIPALQNFPLDLSFLLAYIALSLVRSLLF